MTLKVDVMRDQGLRGKRVLIREDLNVPIKAGVVTSDARLRAALPTIRQAVQAGAKVILMSHLGRPVEGNFDSQFSLAPVADHLSGLLDLPVSLISDWRGGVELGDGEVALLELPAPVLREPFVEGGHVGEGQLRVVLHEVLDGDGERR